MSSETLPLHRYVLAPMVGGSEKAFRILCSSHGAQLCYTPMMHADRLVADSRYRTRAILDMGDRPLVAHVCGNCPEVLRKAAALLAPFCDAVDLNLGCPQRTAELEGFGATLLNPEKRTQLKDIVRAMVGLEAPAKRRRIEEGEKASIKLCEMKPLFCKIRLLDSFEESLQLCVDLADAGCALIAVHARTRGSARKRREGPADLDSVRRLVEALSISHADCRVVTNGNVRSAWDVRKNLELTQASGAMVAEAALDYPALFWAFKKDKRAPDSRPPTSLELAEEYLDNCTRDPPPLGNSKGCTVVFHIRRMLKTELTENPKMRNKIQALSKGVEKETETIEEELTLARSHIEKVRILVRNLR